ncbi:hypothetical protein ACNI3T_00585 [Christiangramia sp. ASW11-125]|uniref:hypothetical protein n=1 Tax=Christiangramia sp. ASW11-125 TaxID=3400701 RepID=UPI003AAE5279
MNYSDIASFVSGGLAGATLKHFVDIYRNRIQTLKCYHTNDEVISTIPAVFSTGQHENLYSKEFKIKNTTNQDLATINITFSFEPVAEITKVQTESKWGLDIPKGNVYPGKKNECVLKIKNFNRNDEIEVLMEIANLETHNFNIQESKCLGIKIKWVDKRKKKVNNSVRMVKKTEL